MKITVIIPALNEEKHIENCLKSVASQTHKDFEIVVADSCSKDRTVEIAKKYTDKVVTACVHSPGPARNLAAKHADAASEVFAFTDADTYVAPDWLERFAKDFEDPKVAGVGGVLRPLDARLLDKIMFKINSDWWYRITAVFGFCQLGTPNCAYRKDAFMKSGGFDESLSMLEDTELSLRMKKYGKIIIDKDAVVYNSARRFVQEGYTTVFLRYLKEYVNLFVLKRGVKSRHFDTIHHKI